MAFRICLLLLFLSSTNLVIADTREGPVKDPNPVPLVEDSRVAVVLDEIGITYRVDEDKDFHIVLELANGRSQQVWVKSVTNVIGDAEMRETWSYAYQHQDSNIPRNITNRVLFDSHRRVLGAWEKQGEFLLYVIKLPAEVDATIMAEAIREAGEVADYWERELGSGDKF